MQVTTIGLDLAKHVLQVHGVDAAGNVVVRKRLKRSEVTAYFAGLEPCLVGIEACSTSHYGAREIGRFGHVVRLMPPAYVKPYVKRGKNDAADAEAICEAVTRPNMRFVAAKTPGQQASLLLHRARRLLVQQRTMTACAIRSYPAEFGIIVGQGTRNMRPLAEHVIRDGGNGLPADAVEVVRMLTAQFAALDDQIDQLEARIEARHRTNPIDLPRKADPRIMREPTRAMARPAGRAGA